MLLMFLTFKSYNLLERAFQCENHKMVISLYLNEWTFSLNNKKKIQK